MAGILDSKERVMDYIVTQEGKRQAGIGEMRVKFASFTDMHTFYETSGSESLPNLTADASQRIFFETFSRYQDVIVPELEAGMSMRPFRTADFQVVGNMVSSGTFKVGFINRADVAFASATNGVSGYEKGYDLPQQMPAVLAGITQNFVEQRLISSIDEYSDSQDFRLSPQKYQFSVDANTKFLRSTSNTQSDGEIRLSDVPSLFHDWRFSRFQNFKYLPPQNLPLPGFSFGDQLGDYPQLEETPVSKLEDVTKFLHDKECVTIKFDPTSRSNNILCQIFESSNAGVEKLAVVDFGTFDDENVSSQESLQSPGKHILFVGKMRQDESGAETFVCIFTIVID